MAMTTKEILKLLNKCNAFAMRHSNERFKITVQNYQADSVWLNLQDADNKCIEIFEVDNWKKSLEIIGFDYVDAWQRVENALALMAKHIKENS